MLGLILISIATFLLTAPVLIEIRNINKPSLWAIEHYISEFDGIIISLGTAVLISALAIIAARLTNKSAERRDANNRRVSAELKLSEFRQNWIDELRNDLSQYGKLGFHHDGLDDLSEFIRLKLKIRMRLNLAEPLAMDLFESMGKVEEARKGGDRSLEAPAFANFAEASHSFLKSEWETLKEKVRKAELSEASEL